MTASGRPARSAKAAVCLVDRPVCCSSCRCSADPEIRFVEVRMPMFPPVDEGSSWVLDGSETLVLCESCIGTAARVLGLYRDPLQDPDVQRLTAAWQVALERLEETYAEHAESLERVRVFEAGVA